MAKAKKTQLSPRSLNPPKALEPIVKAFSFESEETSLVLIEQAAKAIYGESENEPYEIYQKPRGLSKEEFDTVYALMKSINPQDTLETLCAAQIVVGHLLGMIKLAQNHPHDSIIGAKLLRLSSDSMERLLRWRHGGRQNIIVTYNNSGPSMQAIVTPITKE
jgi:hypothetical protein